ncbi:MAG: amidohydrolase [Planctomycetota bacterium]
MGLRTWPLAAVILLIGPRVAAQDLVLRNVHVWSGTAEPWPDDEVVVIDGRIAAPGTQPPESAPIVDLRGAFLLPGWQDAHAHLEGLGKALHDVDLTGTRSYAEVIERVKARAAKAPTGSWIQGRGWDQNDWADTAFPQHQALSAAVPDHPVWLTRVDGHAALANARAMELAGVGKETVEPKGGRIHRAADGNPTGVFVDGAMALVGGLIPDASPAESREQLLAAQEECLRRGLTCVHDAGTDPAVIAVLRQLLVEHRWSLRVYAMLPASAQAAIDEGPWQTPDGVLVVRAVKAYADGALGSRGAALLEPYADEPSRKGFLTTPPEQLVRIARTCVDRGFQLCVHAIGDAGNRAVLDSFQAAVDKERRAALRFRIEHAQVVHPEDFARFRELGVIPSVQPTHMTSDMPWAPARLGPKRVEGAYAWTRFLGLGLHLPLGTDFPVEAVDPRLTLFVACTTRAPDGSGPKEGFRPQGVLDRQTALRGMTADAAFASFAERDLGVVATGMRADFTIFDRDLVHCDAGEILGAKVIATVIGGRVAFRAEGK